MSLNFKVNYEVSLAPTLAGHWYEVKANGKHLGYFPSSTTILNAYPQSAHLTKWIAENGYEEAAQIRDDAGTSGTKIHTACDRLEDGETLNRIEYSLKEWYKINSFVLWFNEVKPKLIAKEVPIFSKKGKFAGRFDRLYEINSELILLDFKSSSAIHPHFPLQFASYAKALEENTNLKITATAVLLLGAANKNTYRYDVYNDWRKHYKVFENVRTVWEYDNFTCRKNPKEPPVLTLPEELKLSPL